MAQDPRRIRKIFNIESLNTKGVYSVNLYVMGIPVTVTVDDYLPFLRYETKPDGTRKLKYGYTGPDGSLWMPILEKAAAKLYGNYEMLSGGVSGQTIMMLTGAPYDYMTHESQMD